MLFFSAFLISKSDWLNLFFCVALAQVSGLQPFENLIEKHARRATCSKRWSEEKDRASSSGRHQGWPDQTQVRKSCANAFRSCNRFKFEEVFLFVCPGGGLDRLFLSCLLQEMVLKSQFLPRVHSSDVVVLLLVSVVAPLVNATPLAGRVSFGMRRQRKSPWSPQCF